MARQDFPVPLAPFGHGALICLRLRLRQAATALRSSVALYGARHARPQWLHASRGSAIADYAPSLRSPWRAAKVTPRRAGHNHPRLRWGVARRLCLAKHRFQRRLAMRRAFLLALVLALAGCGAEVVGTAAMVGAAKVKEAQEAQKQQEQVRQRLGAAAEL